MIESQEKETRELSTRQLCSLDSCLVEKLRTLKPVKKTQEFLRRQVTWIVALKRKGGCL